MPKNYEVGKRFGILTVIEYLGKGRYKCKCDCGNYTTAISCNLGRGHTKSCGCLKFRDLTGKRFGRLTVLGRAENKGTRTSAMWTCKCDCGNTVTVYGDVLVSGYTASCGCIRKDMGLPRELREDFVERTQISKLQAKPTKANKSGIVGVNWDKSRNLWQAGIRFRGKRYNLGHFKDINKAAEVRKAAEERFFGDFLEWYYSQHKKPKA